MNLESVLEGPYRLDPEDASAYRVAGTAWPGENGEADTLLITDCFGSHERYIKEDIYESWPRA